jgi:Alpha 1,4-glycosyltransferase conserved region/Glycosyltransferase sugar-binding region containing DXD motif
LTAAPDTRIIQSLWVDGNLSIMEQISIASFLTHGHEFHLYTYSQPSNVPAGTVLRDGNEILPAQSIFLYQNKSLAGFSNFFRYKLLLERGGWWADLDTVCLKPFHFEEPYVFSSECDRGTTVTNSAVIAAPAGSPFAGYCWQSCQSRNPADLRWGETGPQLVTEAVQRFGLQKYVHPPAAFCPVSYRDWKLLLDPGFAIDSGAGAFAVHLWNEMWRRNNQDKNYSYSPDCPYERLRARYLGA